MESKTAPSYPSEEPSSRQEGSDRRESAPSREDAVLQILPALARAAYGAAGVPDPTEILTTALRQLQQLVLFDTAVVFLAEGNVLRAKAWLGRPPTLSADLAIAIDGAGPTAQVFQSQQLHYVPDLKATSEKTSVWAPDWRSWLGIPLLFGSEKFGVLVLTSARPHQFTETDLRWTCALADYLVAALRNARFAEWAQRGVARLSFLLETASTLSTSLNSEEVLQQLLNLTLKYFRPAAVSIALVNPDGSVTFQAASGQGADKMIGRTLPPGKGIVGWVAAHGQPVWVPSTYADPRFHVQTDQQTGFRTEALYAAPVMQKDRPLAVIEMVNPAQDMELQETREIMAALADLAAPAIENAILFEQVYRAEARYQQLFDHNLDPIVILDEAGQVLDLNQPAQALLAPLASRPEKILETLGLSHDGFAEAKAKLATQAPLIWIYTLPGADGQDRTFKAHLTPLPHYRPEPSYQWLAHDITDQVALEAMREQLSNMIIHDLRGPLNSIINSIDLVRTAWQQKDLTMPIEQLLHISLRSAQRMERLITTILDTARLRQGERPLSVTTFDLATLVREAAEISQPMLTYRKQTLSLRLPPTPLMLQGDLDLLRRVLTNLLTNAIKFTPTGGKVELEVTENDENFYFSVRDNGPGIPCDEQERIFDLYTRGADVRQIEGSGVGLAFCKLAVEAHGGRIWLDSAPGEGATFTFTIPRALSSDVA